jgi:hypothetical protein
MEEAVSPFDSPSFRLSAWVSARRAVFVALGGALQAAGHAGTPVRPAVARQSVPGILETIMRVVILTFGTRGDVQPYLAFGLGLQASGHTVTVATVSEFEPLVGEHGLRFARLRGDFLKAAQSPEGRGNFLKLVRQWIAMARDTLDDEWTSAQGAQVFIYNPAALGGEHIAEKLGVPAFAAFPTPLYTPTREFPSPFFPVASLGPFNRASHRLLASGAATCWACRSPGAR